LFVEYELNQILDQRWMDAPNFPNSFTVDISAYFLGNDWSTNVIENSISFRAITYSTLTFAQLKDVSLVLDGHVIITFFVSSTTYKNPLINLFSPTI